MTMPLIVLGILATVAIAAASELLETATEGTKGAKLIEESIAAVKSRLN